MRIREVRREELTALQEIERAAGQCFRDLGMHDIADEDPPTLSDLMGYHRVGRAWVGVDHDDHPVAYLIADLVDGNIHVDQVSVHPEHARRGIGRAPRTAHRGTAGLAGNMHGRTFGIGDQPTGARSRHRADNASHTVVRGFDTDAGDKEPPAASKGPSDRGPVVTAEHADCAVPARSPRRRTRPNRPEDPPVAQDSSASNCSSAGSAATSAARCSSSRRPIRRWSSWILLERTPEITRSPSGVADASHALPSIGSGSRRTYPASTSAATIRDSVGGATLSFVARSPSRIGPQATNVASADTMPWPIPGEPALRSDRNSRPTAR